MTQADQARFVRVYADRHIMTPVPDPAFQQVINSEVNKLLNTTDTTVSMNTVTKPAGWLKMDVVFTGVAQITEVRAALTEYRVVMTLEKQLSGGGWEQIGFDNVDNVFDPNGTGTNWSSLVPLSVYVTGLDSDTEVRMRGRISVGNNEDVRVSRYTLNAIKTASF